MLEKVWTIWIDGYLKRSLFQEKRILLDLIERPDAVIRPHDPLVQRTDQVEQLLKSGTQVVAVFDAMDQALLILAPRAPGRRRSCWNWPATCSTGPRGT